MALDMSKYSKLAKVKRKLPIIFMINEKVFCSGNWRGGMYGAVITDIMKNLSHRGIDAVMSVVSFGEEVHLWSGFKSYDKYTDKEWPKTTTDGKSVFDIGCMLVKDMLEDIDTTPEGNYDPIVVLISSDEVSPGYEKELEALKENGRFKNVQRIGIVDLDYDCRRYSVNDYEYEMNKHTPQVLKKFAGEKVALFVYDYDYETWCTFSEHGKTTDMTRDHDDTWFCPVLGMMELRYTEDEKQFVTRICGDEGSRGGMFNINNLF